MPNILVVDETPHVAAELQELRPLWVVAHAACPHTALEFFAAKPCTFDLVLVRVSRVPKKIDGIMLVRLLSLHEACKTTRFAVLLERPWDKRDNSAALAAGAARALSYPQTTDATFALFMWAMRLIYKQPQLDAAFRYQFLSGLS